MDTLNSRITINPQILGGKPTIRGLRLSVEQILNALAAGVPMPDLLDDYPELEPEDLHAVFAFAAELIRETNLYVISA